jgi:hypothetical protein
VPIEPAPDASVARVRWVLRYERVLGVRQGDVLAGAVRRFAVEDREQRGEAAHRVSPPAAAWSPGPSPAARDGGAASRRSWVSPLGGRAPRRTIIVNNRSA